MIYIAIDGDDIGQLLTQKIYCEDEEKVMEFSNTVKNSFADIASWAQQNNGVVIFCTGDSVLFRIPVYNMDSALKTIAQKITAIKISIGTGNTIKKAHWALNLAKSLGKDRIIHFDEIKYEIFAGHEKSPLKS